MPHRTADRIEIDLGILGFGDRAGAGVGVPDGIGNAGLARDDAPVAAIGELGIGPAVSSMIRPPTRIADIDAAFALA
ncbi:hypothetical protein ACXIUS_24920 [Bosea thiooxidans]